MICLKDGMNKSRVFDKRAKDDMRVLGEIVLTAHKVNEGNPEM